MAQKKNSLVANINRRKKSGKSRSKKAGTVSAESYSEMRQGWPQSAKKKTAKKKTAAKKTAAKKTASKKTASKKSPQKKAAKKKRVSQRS